MSDRGLFDVTEEGFAPRDERAHAMYDKLRARKDCKPVFLTVRTPRNPEFSALAHVVFSKLADGLGVPMEAIKAYLKEQTGRFDLVKMPDGSFVRMRKSVAFDAMTEEQFRSFWNDALPIIHERLLGGVNSVTFREIADMIEGRRNGRQSSPRGAA